MKDYTRQQRPRTPVEDFSEFGEVRVISRPGPDAEDRLRRLFTLLLRLGAREEEPDESEKLTSESPLPTDRQMEEEA